MSTADKRERDHRLDQLARALRVLMVTARARGGAVVVYDDVTMGPAPGTLRISRGGRRYLLTLHELGDDRRRAIGAEDQADNAEPA